MTHCQVILSPPEWGGQISTVLTWELLKTSDFIYGLLYQNKISPGNKNSVGKILKLTETSYFLPFVVMLINCQHIHTLK